MRLHIGKQVRVRVEGTDATSGSFTGPVFLCMRSVTDALSSDMDRFLSIRKNRDKSLAVDLRYA